MSRKQRCSSPSRSPVAVEIAAAYRRDAARSADRGEHRRRKAALPVAEQDDDPGRLGSHKCLEVADEIGIAVAVEVRDIDLPDEGIYEKRRADREIPRAVAEEDGHALVGSGPPPNS